MDDDRITFRGAKVLAAWPARLAAAQHHREWVIAGKPFARVRFGEEADDWGSEHGPCHDCVAIKGEFHVAGCDVERCPNCGGQVISCDCPYDGDDPAESEDDPEA